MTVQTAVDERFVADTWERQAFKQGAFAELELRLIFRGMPSDAGGPDYQDAIMSAPDGSLLHGDVELHVLASDWRRHGHGKDPRYNRVILHVVWEQDDAETRREDGASVPILALARCAFLRQSPSARAAPSALVPHPCVGSLAQRSDHEVASCIADLGWRRFEERTDLLVAELETVAPGQVLYAALLEALGYASNREVFLHLADAVPLAWLLSIPPAERTATLLDAAGLGPLATISPPAHLAPNSWRLTRLRPGNHPAVRLAGVVELLGRLEPDPPQRLVDVVAGARTPAQLRSVLVARHGREGLIGQGRADEIAASVALPFVAALEPELTVTKGLFALFPSPPPTRWTRSMIDMLAQAGHKIRVRHALEHQGLHYLYTRYCRREGPSDCPVCHPESSGSRGRSPQ